MCYSTKEIKVKSCLNLKEKSCFFINLEHNNTVLTTIFSTYIVYKNK